MPNPTKKDQKKKQFDLVGLIIKQIIATAICFAFVLGMQNCGHPVISNYAVSLGRALRYETDWKNVANSVTEWFKKQFGEFDTFQSEQENSGESQTPISQEITFQ